MSDDDLRDRKVGPDGKCVMTGHPCKCVPKMAGHWCCWSIPKEEVEARAAERQSVERGTK